MKKFDLLQDLKILQEFYTLLDFNFIVIYIILRISVLLKDKVTNDKVIMNL